jgi:polygalacturonase
MPPARPATRRLSYEQMMAASQDKPKGVVNVYDYGAQGNGNTDDTQAFQVSPFDPILSDIY